MKPGALVALVALVAAFAVANAQTQTNLYPAFPFCQCTKTPSPYSLANTVRFKGDSTYCFTLNVNTALTSTAFCAKADFWKLEFNIKTECDVVNAPIKSWVNGVPTKIGPAIDYAKDGPAGSRILRLTQLGLGRSNNGAEICIQLGTNRNGQGCTTLEQLCVPPAGAPAGVCSAAMFDNTTRCCPISTPNPTVVFPYAFDAATCAKVSKAIIDGITAQAAAVGATILSGPAQVACTGSLVKVTVTFFSPEHGALLQPSIDLAAEKWLEVVTGKDCPSYLYGYTTKVTVGADAASSVAAAGKETCLHAEASKSCKPVEVDFPKCQCNTKPASTPFAATTKLSTLPGRNGTTLYCFTLAVITPSNPDSPCGRTTNLLKAEIYADDLRRGLVKGVAVQPKLPNGQLDSIKFMSTTWGARGEDTLKATPLNWSKAQSNGAKVCIELAAGASLSSVCKGSPDTCWINLFDDAKDCCPLYSASP
ncbi:hypothetical protein GPECTOR_14phG2a [Gonium pectorale]|uniref:Pherophorin domain-containing protein n=1 Tax=Gonium pectorale TaxID=33097 RepID=A0A150GP68_GONPE|nr:hypothetical protein GPECTOR_14phG2a [Gonium pectorale]|eukprot:KXZ51120.1 hypothetical protein GPECTOR_14phG2a [Gonium pectorale]